MEYILSFDIAKGKSVYCFIDENKNIIIEPTSINHNKNEFDDLLNTIKKYKKLTVVMESTSVYHLPVENYFRSKGIETIVMNPKLVKQYKDTLNIMGTLSGRDIDKVKETNLTPISIDDSITYKQAKQTFLCKKLYMNQIDKDKLPDNLQKYYSDKQTHYIILGEVIKVS